MTTLVNLTSVGLDIVDEAGRQLLYLPPQPEDQDREWSGDDADDAAGEEE